VKALKKIIISLFLSTTVTIGCYSQSILDTKPSTQQGQNLVSVLLQIEKVNNVHFFFLPDWFYNINIEKNYEGQSLRLILNDLFVGSDLTYIEFNENTIVFIRDPKQAIERSQLLTEALNERKKVETLVFGKSSAKQKNITITGSVKGNKNDEALIGANIFVSDLKKATTTDANGNFSITMPSGEHILNINYLNHDEKVIIVNAYEDAKIQVILEEIPMVLEEVVVQDKVAREAITSNIGQVQLSIKDVKRAPSILGETDLIRQIQVLPGVTTAGEAASGYNVRGGSADQNLILYDGMPIFNSSHVFGFFSAFNSEAVRDVTFYRGGIPAEFGGRVSSVLDIKSREGDQEKWSGGAGIGALTSNFHIGGPIKKNRTTVAASIRTTYSDWLINSIRTNYIDLTNSSVTFYDASFKLAHKFSDRTKIAVSAYTSQDKFRLQGDTSYRWNNLMGSLQLDHIFSSKVTASLHVGYGSYSYEVENRNTINGFNLSYQIRYPSLKLDFRYSSGKHKLVLGTQSSYYGFNPGRLMPNSAQSIVAPIQIQNQQSLESAAYISDQINVNEKLFFEVGTRFSLFTLYGPGQINIYESGKPISLATLQSTKDYKDGEAIQTYTGFEPRASIRYSLSPTSSFKLGYNRIYQYLHLVTNTTAITPVDIWQPSGMYFRPQIADQLSFGYFRTTKNKMYDMFIEFYNKDINNVLDFKDGAKLILNNQIEADLLQGIGKAYGVEVQLAKSQGNLTGSISYTYSRSLRTIKGATPEESINNGKEFPSNFDQPHNININWKYAISRRIFFTGGFTYRTGRPITVPLGGFTIDNITISNFSGRNEYRIPDYHRLDLALVIEGNHKRKKFFDGTWTFSIYNLYGRKNPFTIFFKEAVNGTLIPYQLSIIGTALPSISYSIKF
jgi:hypothetical protein